VFVAWLGVGDPVLSGAYVRRAVQPDNVVVEEWRWVSSVGHQECIQDSIHISLPSQFEEAALEGVDKAFGPTILLGVVRW